MRNQLVYDLPMRLFHWLFAALFVTAFFIAKTVDDESASFTYHMLAGLTLGFIVILRIVWGFVGARYSRFSSFALHPKDLILYFKGVALGDKTRWPGHNPASSWATLAMMLLALGLGVTGYLMANGQKETFEDLHELLANGFLVIVLFHIAGVVLHMFRHRDGIAFSMIDGKKSGVASSGAIRGSNPIAAVLFLAMVVTFTSYLARNFDSQKQSLQLFGTTLQLGEGEGQGHDEDHDEDHD